MALPSVNWDESSPPGSQARSLGDDRIREMKTQIREVVGVDHIWGSSGAGATWGYHNKVTFYNQGSNPTLVADSIILFAKDVSAKSRLFYMNEDGVAAEVMPAGIIAMWSGTIATIPTGWSLCDGTGSTPNLIAKFIRGVATSGTNPGGTGGAEDHTLSAAELTQHSHPISFTSGAGSAHSHGVTDPGHSHTIPVAVSDVDADLVPQLVSPSSTTFSSNSAVTGISINNESAHTHAISGTSGTTPGSATVAFSILPSYYALAYIIRS